MALSNYAGGDDFLLTGFYNNLKQDFYRGQQAQAQQRAAEQKAAQERAKEINGLVNKINPDGLRSFDIPGFYKRYDEIVGLSAKAKNAENGVERAQAFADMQRAIQDTNLYVNSSKEYSQNLVSGASALTKDPEGFTPDSNSYYKTMFSKPIDNLKGESLDISRFVKKPDQNLFEKDVDDIFKRAGTTQDVKLGGTLYDNNGNKILKTRTTTSANPQEVEQRLLDFASSDSNAKRSLAERYPQLPTVQQQVRQFMADNETRLRETKVGTLSSSKGSDGSGGSGVSGAGFLTRNQLQSYNEGKSTFTSPYALQFDGQKALTTGLYDFINEKGEHVKVDASTQESEIGGLVATPVLKRGFKGSALNKKGTDVGSVKPGDIVTSQFASKNPNAVEYVIKAAVRVRDPNDNTYTTYRANPDDVLSAVSLSKSKLAGYNELVNKVNELNRKQSKVTKPTKATKGKEKLSW